VNVHDSLLLSLSDYSAVTASMIYFLALIDDCLERCYPDMSQIKTGFTETVKGNLFGHSGLRFCQINRMMNTSSVRNGKMFVMPKKHDLTNYYLYDVSYWFQMQLGPHLVRCRSWTTVKQYFVMV